MLGAPSKFDLLGARPAGDKSHLKDYVRALARAGFQVVLLEPNSKMPIDVRTAAQKRDDATAAQEIEKAAGNPRWAEAEWRAGIELATSDTKRLDKWIDAAVKRYGEPPNLAIVPQSDMLIIDTDWGEGTELFRETYRKATGTDISLTVSSPGVQNEDGTWKHGPGGGHFYLTLPEGYTLPEAVRTFSIGAGKSEISIFPNDHYVLIPPSVRPEGAYIYHGGVQEAPRALLELLEQDVVQRERQQAERAARRAASNGPGEIDAWAERTPWRDILEPDGWYFTRSRTQCGCPEVTAPGVHASPKSATAHEDGCRELDTSSGHGPLHVWTSSLPEGIAAYNRATGSQTLTKLQYVAWTHHGGDMGAAVRALGIPTSNRSGGTGFASPEELLELAGVTDETSTEEVMPPQPSATAATPSPADTSIRDALRALNGTSDNAPLPAQSPESDEATLLPEGEEDDLSALPEAFRARKFNPNDRTLYPRGFHSDPELLRAIFDFSDETRAIFHHARNARPRRAHPVAVLMFDLLRRGMRCPVECRPWEFTPLSTFVVAVGRSGTGKTVAAMPTSTPWRDIAPPRWLAAKAAMNLDVNEKASESVPAGTCPTLIPFDFDASRSLGSGQVLADRLIRKVGKGEESYNEMLPHPAILLTDDEIMTLFRAAKSESSTIIPTLNSAWAGASIGNDTRSQGDSRTTGAYNVFQWGGLQPKFAAELLKHDDSGYTQRGFKVGVTDPFRRVNQPSIPVPVVQPDGAMPVINPGDTFRLDPRVIDAIDAVNEDADFDHLPDPEEEVESHLAQVQLRIACLGALLHKTLTVSWELWVWAGHLIEHSRRVHAWMVAEAKLADDTESGKEGARRAQIAAAQDRETSSKTNEVAAKFLNKLKQARAKGITRSDLRSSLTGSERDWTDKALAHLLTKGMVTQEGARFFITAKKVSAESVAS